MALRFEWDAQKAAANLTKHGVSFREAATVFGDPLSSTFVDPRHSVTEVRFVTFGFSHRHRLLAVMHSEQQATDLEGSLAEVIRLISARRATPTERGAYEEES